MSGDQLTERLKEQVSASIQDALSKATSVLSNLHRVQSYLDVLQSLPVSRAGDVIKSAVEQVKGMRADTATLLQTVYLTEIGLSSLQELDKGGGVVFNEGLSHDQNNSLVSNNSPEENSMETEMSFVDSVTEEEEEPLPKKLKLGVSIQSCVNCNRKFAQQSTSDDSTLCRVCRDEQSNESTLSHSQPTNKIPSTAPKSTPRKKRRSSGVPQKCRLCGTEFVYRRCLLRHIKENHPETDQSHPEQYIVAAEAEQSNPIAETGLNAGGTDVHLMTTEDSIVEQVMGEFTPSSLHVTIETEEGSLPISASDDKPTQNNEQPDTSLDGYDTVEKIEGGKCAVVTLNGEKLYKCLLCGKTFTRPYRIQRHLQVHNPSRSKVQCHLCGKQFTRVDTLQTHIRCVHTNDRPFACTFEGCDKRFPVQSGLVHHLKSHMDGKPYKCAECSESFALMTEFKAHMNSAHASTKALRCADCFKLFSSTEELETHRSLEHRLECEICNKTFAKLGFLQAHVEIHNGPSLYNCRFCNSGFDNEYSYKQHVKTHPKYTRVRKVHPCPVCGDIFLDSKDLMAHYQTEAHRTKVKSLGVGNTILAAVGGQALSERVAAAEGISEEELIQSISDPDAFQAALGVASGVE